MLLSPEQVRMLQQNASVPMGGGGQKTEWKNGRLVLKKEYQDGGGKTRGRGGTATSLISEGAGAGGAIGGAATGAAIGSIVPGAGTLVGGIIGGGIGGLLGGFGGRAAENKIRDDEWRLEDALNEGLLSGAFGAAGGAFQGARAAKALKGFNNLDDAAKAATGIGRAGGNIAGKSYYTTGQLNKMIGLQKGAIQKGGERAVAKRAGVSVNKNITPEQSKEAVKWITDGSKKYVSGGIRAGTSGSQADDAARALAGVTDDLSKQLDKVNRALTKTQKDRIITAINKNIGQNANITTRKNADKLIAQIKKAKDIKGLEKIRMSADDLIYTNRGVAGTSAKASQGQAVRGAIDDFVTGLKGNQFSRYKELKGTYRTAKEVAESAAEYAGRARGTAVPFASGGIGGFRLPETGVASRLARARLGAGNFIPPQVPVTGIRQGLTGMAARTIGNNVTGNVQPVEQETPQDLESALMGMSGDPYTAGAYDMGGQDVLGENTETAYNPYSPQNLEDSIIQIMQQGGDLGDVKDFLSIATTLNEIRGMGGDSGLNVGSVTAQQYGLAESGQQSLNQLRGLLSQDPGVLTRSATPGRRLPVVGGFIANAAGTGEYDAVGYNIADALLRLRTGAQANESEIRNVQTQIMPRAGDSPATIQRKLDQLEQIFGSTLTRAYDGGVSPTQQYMADPTAEFALY